MHLLSIFLFLHCYCSAGTGRVGRGRWSVVCGAKLTL